MAKLRLEITKEAEIRFISHLDYASAIERAIRRAKLPAAYSEGFNPHMKIAFASALAVGVTSSFEYMDLELKEEIAAQTVISELSRQLPPGIKVHQGKYMPDRSAALMSIVRLASYTIHISLPAEAAIIENSLQDFNAKKSIPYTRRSHKGVKEIDLKEYLLDDIRFLCTAQEVKLSLNIKIMPNGSVKPS
ncbi:MAG: TIGR03936 family radical SAM-associated protein, partial [Pelosinus sp.]|nr:TIGR03936 family radical SAM-associated protein [Pelosinus sp.]